MNKVQRLLYTEHQGKHLPIPLQVNKYVFFMVRESSLLSY